MNNPKLSLLASAAPSGVAFSFADATFSPKPWGQRTVHSRDIRVKVECFFCRSRILSFSRSAYRRFALATSEKILSVYFAGAVFCSSQSLCYERFLSDIRVIDLWSLCFAKKTPSVSLPVQCYPYEISVLRAVLSRGIQVALSVSFLNPFSPSIFAV